MNTRKIVSKSAASSRARPSQGSSSSTLLLVLLLLVAGGGFVAWFVLGSAAQRPAPEPKPTPPVEAPQPTPAPEPAVAATGPDVDADQWKKELGNAARVPVQGASRDKVEGPVATLEGDVVDAETSEPVYYAWLYLVPPDRGDVVEASKSWTPSRFRNGHFKLERQPVGTYNVLCESREHDAWTGTIKLPYDGNLKIRLKHGTSVEGIVRDVNQTPLEGIDMQLVVDLEKIDAGANPPMQRLAKTDKLGHYSFNKLPPGSYGLQATLTSDVLASEPEFRVDQNATVKRDFSLPRLGTLKLLIKNVADQPLSRARVALVQEHDGRERRVRTAYSDIKGVARVEFIRAGSYKLQVQVQGFETWEDQVNVAASDDYREVPVQLRVAAKSGN